MSSRVLTRDFNPAIQPKGKVRLRRGDPLASGLMLLYLPPQPGLPGTLRDLCGNLDLNVQGTPSIGVGPHGVQAFDAASSGWSATSTPTIQGITKAVSLFWYGDLVSAGSLSTNPYIFGCLWGNGSASPYTTWSLARLSTAKLQFAWNSGGSLETVVTSSEPGAGQLGLVGTLQIGGTANLYMQTNGAFNSVVSNSSPGAAGMSYGSPSPAVLAGNPIGTAYAGSAMAIAAVWNRALSEQEVARLFAKPYAMLESIERTIYAIPAAAPPSSLASGEASALALPAFQSKAILYASQLNTAVSVLDGGSVNQSELFIPTTGQICNLTSGIKWHDIQPAAPLAALTVVMPETAGHGELHSITLGQDIYQLNVMGNAGQSLRAAPGQAVADSCLSWRMYGPSSTWRRVS